jgi:anaphase-promoting complex subunit 4
MADTAAELPLFSASKLNAAVVPGGRLACNPVIDLTASVADGGNTVCIWRANDQLVAGHAERNQKADVLRWKEDGMCPPTNQTIPVDWLADS